MRVVMTLEDFREAQHLSYACVAVGVKHACLQ